MMTNDCVAYLLTYELHVLEIYVYGASYAIVAGSKLQNTRVY